MLSAIVQKQTGLTVLDYLRPRLFEPLGITQPVWNTNFQGISLGGYGLSVRTEDIARFGQLYLQNGKWNGKQLVAKEWVDLATSRQVSNGSNPKSDWDQGYGFQFWRCRNGAYRGDGAFGQYCIVLPEQDAVIAITSGLKDMQGVMNLIWDKLLPSFEPKKLKPDAASQKKLIEKLSHLMVPPAAGGESSALGGKLFGRKFIFAPNEQKLEAITLTTHKDGVRAVLQSTGAKSEFTAGYRNWNPGRASFAVYNGAPVAGTFAWSADDTLLIKQCFTETPFYVTHRFRLEGDQLFYEAQRNIGFGPTKQPQLVGRAE